MEFPKISLRAARVNANLSQRDAAEALGVNVSTIQNYETGKTVPDWEMVKQIEKVYRFPADFIIFTQYSAESVIQPINPPNPGRESSPSKEVRG